MKFYNLGDKSFETDLRKHVFVVHKTKWALTKNNHTGGGCKVFIILCGLGKLKDSPLSVSLKGSMVFNSDLLANSLLTSQNP